MLTILSACSGEQNPTNENNTAADAAVDETSLFDATPDDVEPTKCSRLTSLPVTPSILTGFSGAENFAFDASGNLVSNVNGSILEESKSGNTSVLATSVDETAGMQFLSNGDLVVASITHGELWAFTTDGERRTIRTELQNPAGLAIDQDDLIYVAEPGEGRILQVHPTTGETTIVAQGLVTPHGLSFSPDYRALYVGSFGDGSLNTVLATSNGTWESATRLGGVTNPCEGHASGDLCIDYVKAGVCVSDGQGALECQRAGNRQETFQNACTGSGIGDECLVSVGSSSFPGTCAVESGLFACAPKDDIEQVCAGRDDGESCEAAYAYGPTAMAYNGTCQEGACTLRADFLTNPDIRGRLDALAVDACGNVYATEYVTGHLWRFTSEGERELVAALPSAHPSSLHWGSGVGGWDENTLYVMDTSNDQLFELNVGVAGKPRIFP